jgi:hypothetical protein
MGPRETGGSARRGDGGGGGDRRLASAQGEGGEERGGGLRGTARTEGVVGRGHFVWCGDVG